MHTRSREYAMGEVDEREEMLLLLTGGSLPSKSLQQNKNYDGYLFQQIPNGAIPAKRTSMKLSCYDTLSSNQTHHSYI